MTAIPGGRPAQKRAVDKAITARKAVSIFQDGSLGLIGTSARAQNPHNAQNALFVVSRIGKGILNVRPASIDRRWVWMRASRHLARPHERSR